MKNLFSLFSVFMLIIAGDLAACAVCMDGTGYDDNTRNAYYFISILLTVVPVSIGLALLFFIRRRIRQREE